MTEEKKMEKKEQQANVENPTEKKEEQQEEKTKPNKKEVKKVVKKEEAVAYAFGKHMSPKQATYICSFIKNKQIDKAISDLNMVIKMKKAVPFKGEIPHRKGMMSGRYPMRASAEFISVLKGLRGNVLANGMELDNSIIYHASASHASKPYKSGGRRAKRTNLILKAKERKNG